MDLAAAGNVLVDEATARALLNNAGNVGEEVNVEASNSGRSSDDNAALVTILSKVLESQNELLSARQAGSSSSGAANLINSKGVTPNPTILPVQVCHGVDPLPGVLVELALSGRFVEAKAFSNNGIKAVMTAKDETELTKALLP